MQSLRVKYIFMHVFRPTYVKIRLFKIQKYSFQKYDEFEQYQYVFSKIGLAKGQIPSYFQYPLEFGALTLAKFRHTLLPYDPSSLQLEDLNLGRNKVSRGLFMEVCSSGTYPRTPNIHDESTRIYAWSVSKFWKF